MVDKPLVACEIGISRERPRVGANMLTLRDEHGIYEAVWVKREVQGSCEFFSRTFPSSSASVESAHLSRCRVRRSSCVP